MAFWRFSPASGNAASPVRFVEAAKPTYSSQPSGRPFALESTSAGSSLKSMPKSSLRYSFSVTSFHAAVNGTVFAPLTVSVVVSPFSAVTVRVAGGRAVVGSKPNQSYTAECNSTTFVETDAPNCPATSVAFVSTLPTTIVPFVRVTVL